MGTLKPGTRRRLWPGLLALLAVVVILALLPPLHAWQQSGEQRSLSLSNLRRLATSAQLYAQDYDGRIIPPAERLPDGLWLTWPDRLNAYGAIPAILDNPANPVSSAPGPLKHPTLGYKIRTSYALNRRFFGTFAPGPFSLDNLELPEQTVLFIEAGPMWSTSGRQAHDPPTPHRVARLDYGDTTDRTGLLFPYPSTHEGRIAVAAADGHAVTVRVEHYTPSDGPHDPLYGRLGGNIYNWNGGHPNGETDRPPHE
jgi:hypothetical protein